MLNFFKVFIYKKDINVSLLILLIIHNSVAADSFFSNPFNKNVKENHIIDKDSNNNFSKEDGGFNKKISFLNWNKSFSNIGQKKFYNNKQSNRSFDKDFKKEIKTMHHLDIDIAKWDNQLAKIRKKAQISLSQEAQLLGDKENYILILQNLGYLDNLKEELNLEDINRYQFRSNQRKGKIPIDTPN